MKTLLVEEARLWLPTLKAGDTVSLCGRVYTARDAAHQRLCKLLDAGEELPISLAGAFLYYAGPTPAPAGKVCGSFGPTTSCRMDGFAPRLYREGVLATIGKGGRSPAVKEAITEVGGVYLIAVGGAGAFYSSKITSCREIAFHDLGCESIKELTFKDFPLTVAMDSKGGDLFSR